MMLDLQVLQKRVFNVKNQEDFCETALDIFNYQYNNNKVYNNFVNSLGKDPSEINTLSDIPFLPVEFFRNHKIITSDLPVEKIFESSGTTVTIRSKHYINDLKLYEESFQRTF